MTDVELFLAHYGTKGQKWGIRNKRFQKGLKIGGAVLGGAAVIAGGVFANKLLKKHALLKATDLRTAWNRGTYPMPPNLMRTPLSSLSDIHKGLGKVSKSIDAQNAINARSRAAVFNRLRTMSSQR